MPKRLTGPAGLLVLLVLVATGAAEATDASPFAVTRSVQATKDDLNPSRTYSAPYLAVDPKSPLHMAASFIEFRTGRCGLLRSTDGGGTWTRAEGVPADPSFPFCESTQSGNGIDHAPIAFGRNHTLYYAMLGWDTQDGGGRLNTSVMLARSTDLGDTWQTTIVRNNRGKTDRDIENTRPMAGVAVDTSGSEDIVYVSYLRRYPNAVAPNAEPNKPVVAVSTDGWRTFGEPVSVVDGLWANGSLRAEAVSKATTTTAAPGTTPTTLAAPPGSRAAQPDQEANFGGGKAAMALDDKGTVYVAWPTNYANQPATPPPGHFLSKSTDQGKTWTVTQIAPFSYKLRAGAPGPNASLRMAWSPEGGPDGTLHVVVEGSDSPDIANLSDVWYYRSTDGGKTWSDRKLLDDDPRQLYAGQYMPNVSVAPNGRVDVVWWDTRDDPGSLTNDVYYASSTDNGETFSKNVRITERSIDRRYGVFLNNFNMSAPPGVASTNAYALIGWDDTRLTDPNFADNKTTGGGLQDIFTAAVQYEAIGGGGVSKALKVVLAGVAGLVAVALVLFVVMLSTRRQNREGSPSAPERQPVGVE